MTTTKRNVPLGTVSHGTLRTADLLDSFADALEDCADRFALHGAFCEDESIIRDHHRNVVREAREVLDLLDEEEDSEDVDALSRACDVLVEVQDALEAYAPPYCYWGAHEGDGSDFGFWIAWESLEEDSRYGEDVVKVGDTSDVPEDWTEYVLQVSDHGNATLYDADGVEVWAVV